MSKLDTTNSTRKDEFELLVQFRSVRDYGMRGRRWEDNIKMYFKRQDM
jgi:hypothetical protein